MKKKESAFSEDWNSQDWQSQLENIYDKTVHDAPLTQEEHQLVSKTPDKIIKEVDQRKQQEAPLVPSNQMVPRFEHVWKGPEDEIPLTPEERDQLVSQSPEAKVLNTFVPEVFDQGLFFKEFKKDETGKETTEINAGQIDASLNTLSYLKQLGYQNGYWRLGPEHLTSFRSRKQLKNHCKAKVDGVTVLNICAKLNNINFTIDSLMQKAHEHATAHGYWPPKPLISMSHPGCKCSILLLPPASPDEIPDSAPGVNTFDDDEAKLHSKNIIFSRLTTIVVDRWTVLSREVYKRLEKSQDFVVDEYDVVYAKPTSSGIRRYKNKKRRYGNIEDDRIKIASDSWREEILPIAISHSFIFKSVLGSIRPVPDTYRGFQTETNGEHSVVFLSDLNDHIIAPVKCIKELRLRPNEEAEVEPGSFLNIDDSFGIVISAFDDKILCYLPELDSTVFVNSGTVYEPV